jgi:hypothetical protein
MSEAELIEKFFISLDMAVNQTRKKIKQKSFLHIPLLRNPNQQKEE